MKSERGELGTVGGLFIAGIVAVVVIGMFGAVGSGDPAGAGYYVQHAPDVVTTAPADWAINDPDSGAAGVIMLCIIGGAFGLFLTRL
jgi:hypothetical protein